MKKTKIKLLANICLGVVCTALFALLLVFVISGYLSEVLKIVISSLVGLLVVFLLN